VKPGEGANPRRAYYLLSRLDGTTGMKILNHPHTENNRNRYWRPGDPIPPANSGIEPNPHQALARNVEAAARDQQRQRFQTRRPADRREAA